MGIPPQAAISMMHAAELENGKLRADNARLRAALARYGDHEYECALKDGSDCSCGYEAAVLTGKEG